VTWNPSLIDGPVRVPDVTGYHLNVAPDIATGLDAWRIEPTSPERVFAGAETVFLKFADEAEARAMLGAYWMEPEDAP
jgi:hypothetical protein